MEFTIGLSEVLYIMLIILVMVLIYVAIQLACILKNVRTISDKLAEVAEIINHYAWKPVQFGMMIYKKMQSVVGYVEKRKAKRKSRKKKAG